MKSAAALAVLGSLALGAQEQPVQRFRSGAELVAVDVLVTEGRRPVMGLTAADFVLLDNGVPQAVQQLHLAQMPLSIIMVLDTSWSVDGERLHALKRAASALVQRMRQEDRAAVISFSHRLELRAALMGDRQRLHHAIDALAAEGSTSLRDAAYAGLAMRGSDAGRALMLLFSDGVDTSSFLDERRVLEAARRSDVTIYPVGLRDEPTLMLRGGRAVLSTVTNAAPADDRFLKALATQTGGRVVYAQGNRDLGPTFGRVLDEFNTRYVLGYTPTGVARAGWHQIEVKLKNRRGTVTARRGYFAK